MINGDNISLDLALETWMNTTMETTKRVKKFKLSNASNSIDLTNEWDNFFPLSDSNSNLLVPNFQKSASPAARKKRGLSVSFPSGSDYDESDNDEEDSITSFPIRSPSIATQKSVSVTRQSRVDIFRNMFHLSDICSMISKGNSSNVRNQNVYDFLGDVNTHHPNGIDFTSTMSHSTVERLARTFLTGDYSYTTHIKNTNSMSAEITKLFEYLYTLDNKEVIKPESVTAPELHFGRLQSEEIYPLVDWNSRIIVKTTDINTLWYKQSLMVDIATDIIIGAVMAHLLVLAHDNVVSPHMVFPLDWFAGLAVDVSVNTMSSTPTILLQYDKPMQYVIMERADKDMFTIFVDDNASPRIVRSILFQLLYTLEASDDIAGYKHGDLHTSNVMVRNVGRDSKSPYRQKDWLYIRSSTHHTGPTHVVIPYDEHKDIFVEIIDHGRARAYCPLVTPSVYESSVERILFGNPLFEKSGVYVDEARVDPSWDLRRFFYYAAVQYDLVQWSALADSSQNANDMRLCDNLKELFAVGSNMIAFVRYLQTIKKIMYTKFQLESTIIDMYYDAVYPIVKELLDINNRGGDYENHIPDHDMAVSIYNVMAPYLLEDQRRSPFNTFIGEIFQEMTIKPITPPSFRNHIDIPTSRNVAITPSLCLKLTVFSDLPIATGQDTVLVGMVHEDWTRWNKPYATKNKHHYQGFAAAVESTTSTVTKVTGEPLQCVICARVAHGYMTHPVTQELIEQAFCSDICMKIHAGDIRAVRPF
jgi:hypothetical protein